jgi:hypothetical protein
MGQQEVIMDNNQQVGSQPAGSPEVGTVTAPGNVINPGVTNLNLNEAKTLSGGMQSPFTGADVSMTTGQAFGGPIVSTEQGSVNNVTRPTAQ